MNSHLNISPDAELHAMRDLLFQLSVSIRDSVRPWVRAARGSEVVGYTRSGDATFKIDEVAEEHLTDFLRKTDVPIACLSEDKGLVMPQGGTPQWLLIVDPVDGSRNAKSGFEGCLVSIALLKYSERPTLADVTHGLLHEIVGDRIFYAEKERATVLHYRDKTGEPSLSSNEDMSLLRWSLTVPGRPASLVFNLMADLIDVSSVTGGFFSCNSTCYSISRLLTGQQDAYIDIADRLAKEFPAAVTELYEKSGTRIWGFSSYDIAAAYLIAKQAGVVITDAYGCSLDDMELLDASPGNVRSCVAASNESLHVKLLEYIDEHIRKFQPRGG